MPLEQKHPLHSLKTDIQKNLLNDIGSQGLQNLIDTSLCVNIQIDGLGQIQAENTHNGLGVDYVSAGYQIEVNVELGQVIYERLYFINGI
jgi:hypothetical protein